MNTPFNNVKLDKILILKILESWMNKSRCKNLCYDFNITKKSLKRLLSKVRRTLVPSYYNSLAKLGGESIIVEIDESKFGKRKYNRGHHVNGREI